MGIAIIGMAEDREIPQDRELWGMPWDGEWASMDVLFDLHAPKDVKDLPYTQRLPDVWQPLYMQDNFYNTATRYPIEDAIKIGGDYFSCSIAYMLAFAVIKKIKDILLVGVTALEAYKHQRPCIEYWVGIGRGLGLKIETQGGTQLFTGDRYGYGNIDL